MEKNTLKFNQSHTCRHQEYKLLSFLYIIIYLDRETYYKMVSTHFKGILRFFVE